MRISESQLKRIVRAIIREQTETAPPAPAAADSWISMDDVAEIVNNKLADKMSEHVYYDIMSDRDWHYRSSYDTEKFVELVQELLHESDAVQERFAAAHPDASDDDYFEAVEKWSGEHAGEISDFIESELENIKDNMDMSSGNETDDVFGSEAGYWRYRNG